VWWVAGFVIVAGSTGPFHHIAEHLLEILRLAH
jgi:hypothetical protein